MYICTLNEHLSHGVNVKNNDGGPKYCQSEKNFPLALSAALSECATGAHDVSIDCIKQSAAFL